jgi:3'-5' exoribonuclease
MSVSSTATAAVRDFEDGSTINHILLVREAEVRQTRNGADFLRLALADRTGVVAGIVWDDVDTASALARPGEPVQITGSFTRDPRYGPQVKISALHVPTDVDWDDLLRGPATPAEELEHDLTTLLESLRDRDLHALIEALLGIDSPTGKAYRVAFAAQYNHHAYRSGLLEHSLEVTNAVDAAAGIFPGIDRDIAVCGALLHDIGKLDAYSGDEHAVAINDAGRLIGEIPTGYYLVRRQIENQPNFPAAKTAQALLHIILSHHGCLEYGSPVVPATREALLVHTMDNLSGDLGSFERLERETTGDAPWSRILAGPRSSVRSRGYASHQHQPPTLRASRPGRRRGPDRALPR